MRPLGVSARGPEPRTPHAFCPGLCSGAVNLASSTPAGDPTARPRRTVGELTLPLQGGSETLQQASMVLMQIRATNTAMACADALLCHEPVGRSWVVGRAVGTVHPSGHLHSSAAAGTHEGAYYIGSTEQCQC
jgi:hypothetical protein